MSHREELLLKMYDQMFNDINRHIMVVWQSVGVLVGAFAIFALVEKNVVTLDVASSIVLLLCAWLIAHLFDAAYWYNRNLVIIANIERQFLNKEDLNNIHYYFGEHRKNNKMIDHLRQQVALGLGLGGIVLVYHFSVRVVPGFSAPWTSFELARAIPYILVSAAAVYLKRLKFRYISKYAEILKNSPGKRIDTSQVVYGVGHGHDEKPVDSLLKRPFSGS